MINFLSFLFEQGRIWKSANTSNTQFLNRYSHELRDLEIACTFSPEYIEEQYQDAELIMPALEAVVEEFKIRNIRLGIRWNSVDNGKSIDLSNYKPILKYSFKKGVKVVLNVGPIKTFRWPEQYVPEYILNQIQIPPRGAEILPDSELSIHAKKYLEKLYKCLQKEFSAQELSHIVTIQLENEPFHRFGEYEWRMSEEYMAELMELTLKYFPQVGFLINSSETRNLHKTSLFYKKMIEVHPQLKSNLILGYNFFYKVPDDRRYPIIGTFDSVTLTNVMLKKLCSRNVMWSKQIGYKIEVTEGQTEPWPPIMSPGNSVHEFRYLILRSIRNLLNCQDSPVLRVWGIEHLAVAAVKNRLSDEQKQIIDLIHKINTK